MPHLAAAQSPPSEISSVRESAPERHAGHYISGRRVVHLQSCVRASKEKTGGCDLDSPASGEASRPQEAGHAQLRVEGSGQQVQRRKQPQPPCTECYVADGGRLRPCCCCVGPQAARRRCMNAQATASARRTLWWTPLVSSARHPLQARPVRCCWLHLRTIRHSRSQQIVSPRRRTT